jgi:hypothetical protein
LGIVQAAAVSTQLLTMPIAVAVAHSSSCHHCASLLLTAIFSLFAMIIIFKTCS